MTHLFDEFSKSLDESVPRRESLRRFGAVLAGAVFGSLGPNRAEAAIQNPCKTFCRCQNKTQQSQCLAACKACGNNPARMCGSCGAYGCCGDGQACCGDYCADLESDVDNCGECGYVCEWPGPNEYGACAFGECVYTCAEGADRCDGMCTFLDWDPHNCGECGHVCGGATPHCNLGVCTSELCPGGGTWCNGVCTNLAFDTLNCGACGVVCGWGQTCSGGVCQDAW